MTDLAKIYRVKIEDDPVGLFYATSPDLRGLLVARPTVGGLYEAILEAIAALVQAGEHRSVYVFAAARGEDPMVHPFVAIPEATVWKMLGMTRPIKSLLDEPDVGLPTDVIWR
jgi:hypothetical protein